jgi:hypothetical protein
MLISNGDASIKEAYSQYIDGAKNTKLSGASFVLLHSVLML